MSDSRPAPGSPRPTSENLTWNESAVGPEERRRLLGHESATVWFTGLSGSGKSTLANAFEHDLFTRGCAAFVLDGDNLRHGLNSDLGFSPEHRVENIRRAGEVAGLLNDAGLIVLTAFISPYRSDRAAVRQRLGGRLIEVFVDCPLDECERRDPKGLYRRARSGEIAEFTGVSAPYEPPERPDLRLPTAELDVEGCLAKLRELLRARGIV